MQFCWNMDMQILLLCSGLLLPFTGHSVCGVGLIAPLLLAFMIFSLNSGIPILLGGIVLWLAFLPFDLLWLVIFIICIHCLSPSFVLSPSYVLLSFFIWFFFRPWSIIVSAWASNRLDDAWLPPSFVLRDALVLHNLHHIYIYHIHIMYHIGHI